MNQQQWWKLGKDDCHGRVFGQVEELEERQGERTADITRNLGLYLDREISSMRQAFKDRSRALWKRGDSLVHLNVIKSCIDTVESKLVPNRPRPMAVTVGGRFDDRRIARKLDRYLEGLFYQQELYDVIAPHVFLDAGINGTGVAQVDADDEGVFFEWSWIGEFIIDEVASCYAKPRTLYRRRWVSRDVLVALYPKSKSELGGVDTGLDAEEADVQEDILEVIEAWHLASRADGKDGRHVVVCRNGVLLDEKWEDDDFPFVFFKWSRSPIGFWGVGLASELEGIQMEINALLEKIQANMDILATAWVFASEASGIPKEMFTNQGGTIIPYNAAGGPPSVYTPASMHGQVFDHLWQLYQRAFEISGVSQMSSAAKRPEGIESGRALQTLIDVETQRFALLARDWEHFFLQVAKKAITASKKAYKGNRSAKVAWVSKNLAEQIDWSDIADLAGDDNNFVMRLYPINLLPQTPTGKLDRIERMLQMGLLTPDRAKSLLDYPDVEKIQDLETAAFEDFLRMFDDMLYEGKWTEPQVEMILELGIPLAQQYWNRGHLDGAPEERTDLFIQWMEKARQRQKEQAALQPPAPVPMDSNAMPPPGMGAGMMAQPGMMPEGVPPGAMGLMQQPPLLGPEIPPPGMPMASPADLLVNQQ